jgi:multidrug efflux pump subunit AcrA (membrane-fusion protein)
MKKYVVIAVILAVAAAGGLWYRSYRAKQKAAEKPPAAAVVERGSIRQTVASTGKIVSNLDVEIKCKASGQILKLPFDVSDQVRKGDLLIELDPKDEQQHVRQAEATVRASKARLVNARESLAVAEETLASDRQKVEAGLASAEARARDARAKAERTRELKAKKLASLEEAETADTAAAAAAADLETARAQVDALKTQARAMEQARQQIRIAEAQVESDQVDLDLARQRLVDTSVYAPIDGVVTANSVQIGQIISSGISNVGGGTTAMIVSDLSKIFALASVDESDIGQVTVGHFARVTVDAYPGKRFDGTVVRIAPRGVNVSNVVTFEVKVEVTSPEKRLLRPEMTANVEVLIAEKSDVLLVPADAILRKGGKPTVTIQEPDGTTEEREVRTGITDGKNTEITSGLAGGEKVIRNASPDSRWQGQGSRAPNPMRAIH